MYHCQLHFYLVGEPCGVFDTVKTAEPLPRFSHSITESREPLPESAGNADVIFAHLPDGGEEQMLRAILADARENSGLLVLVESGRFQALEEFLPRIADVWTLPMGEEESRYRFRRWQQAVQKERDAWQTSQYLETTINSIPNLVWYKRRDGIHEKVNDSFCQTVNKTKEQVQGRDHAYIWGVDPSESGGDCAESDLAAMEQRRTVVSEEAVDSAEGTRLLTTYKSPLYDLDGSVMGTVGVGIDVTQERAYEREVIKKTRTLETIFSALDCGVLCHSLDGKRILSVNQVALQLLGYDSREELLLDGFRLIAATVVEEDQPRLIKCMQTLKKPGDSVSAEYRVRHKDGKTLSIMGNIKLMEGDGELFYQRFLLDVTAQRQQEAAKEKYHVQLVQALTIDYRLVFFFDLDTGKGTALRIDEKSQKAFGFAAQKTLSLKECLEAYIEAFVYEEDREMVRHAISPDRMREELERRSTYYVHYRITVDGKILYYELKVVRSGAWDEGHGIVFGVRSVDEETRGGIKQRRLLEDALQQANRANEAKSVFLSNMSHDIRTPMNAIIGFTTLALAHMDDPREVREDLQKIKASGAHLLDLVNDVLDMSLIESGKLRLEEAPCRLPDIIEEVGEIVQPDASAKNLRLSLGKEGVPGQEIYCDRVRLSQVLLNVVSNSVKYTPDGGAVCLTVKENPGAPAGFLNVVFCVRDTGIGMSREFLTHIFDPFERERNTTSSGIRGTGLGMAITRSIIDMMDGTIQVESEPGVGTAVTFSLCFRLAEIPEETIKEEAADVPRGLPAELPGGRILLAEDNELNQEIASELLKDAGFETEVAGNGQIAVEMLKNSAPGYYSLVLMDVQMPVMNGYDAARAIRGLPDPALACVPILAMTANAFDTDRQAALDSGMDGHIAKPIDVGRLLQEIKEVLGAKREAQPERPAGI